MSKFPRLVISVVAVSMLSIGCRLTNPCGLGVPCGRGSCEPAVGSSCGCGAASCNEACTSPACGGGCRIGPLLGLSKVRNLFRMYNCQTGGCGEVYWHDWISDPPCADPCDSCGNWTGAPAVASCGPRGPGLFERPVLSSLPGGPNFRRPGRMLFSGWLGLSRFGQDLKRGIPCCGSAAGACGGSLCGGCCTSCAGGDEYVGHGPRCACGGTAVVHDSHDGSSSVSHSSQPHGTALQHFKETHGRPPHRVLADRLR